MNEVVAKQVILFILKRNGKEQISESDFFLTLSMQLQWCPPHIAKQFVRRAIQDGLLLSNGSIVSAGFSSTDVKIPLDFKPSLDYFNQYQPRQPSLDSDQKTDLLSKILSETSFSREDIESSLKTIMNEQLVLREVALLLFAKNHDVDISSFIPQVEKDLFKENTK